MNHLLQIIKDNIGQSRLCPIWKIRKLYGKDFDEHLTELLQTYRVELTGGNPATLSEDQLSDCIKLDGMLFLNIAYYG